MTVEEFCLPILIQTLQPVNSLTDNWKQQLVDDFVTGTSDSHCDEDTQEETHVAA